VGGGGRGGAVKEQETIRLLRHALACVWTELEKDAPDCEGAQRVAGEALERSAEWAEPRQLNARMHDVGIEGWPPCSSP